MAEDGFAGTHGRHGRFAKGIKLNCIEIDFHDNLLASLHQGACSAACLSLPFFSVCSLEPPTADKMGNSRIKDISVDIHPGPHAIHAPAVDGAYRVLLQILHLAD